MSWRSGGASEDAHIMLVSAHPDDEGIFGGGVLCYYSQMLDLNVVEVQMAGTDQGRLQELQNAVGYYVGGGTSSKNGFGDVLIGNAAIVNGMLADIQGPADNPRDPGTSWAAWGNGDQGAGRAAAATIVAAAIRRYRPQVIASAHSLVGDYGHTNHTATAIAAIDGVGAAVDASREIDELPAWAASKLYVRGDQSVNKASVSWGSFTSTGGIGQLFHDHWETRVQQVLCSSRQVVNRGLLEHVSQMYLDPVVATVHCVPTGDWGFIRAGHPSEQWTLYSSTVGADTLRDFVVEGAPYPTGWSSGDFLEHTKIPNPAPSVAAPMGRGVNVSAVLFETGSFEQTGCRSWQEFDTNSATPRFDFVETSRTDAVVALTDDSRRVDVQIALDDGWVKIRTRTDSIPDPPYTDVYQITEVDQQVTGRLVRVAVHPTGQFQRAPSGGWVEVRSDGTIIYEFVETSRDRWTVGLHDASRSVDLSVDMQACVIRYRDSSKGWFDLYQIVDAW